MPEKPLTIAAYAAGASLAAVTLVYVFGPTFFLDDESKDGRRRGVVGLSNPANLCFVNSVLQVLAGLGDMRIYLIRELHRRQINISEHNLEGLTEKQLGLRKGILTQALKVILDQLNERPIYRKTVSAREFIAQLERAFKTRLSTSQQDAQELFQIVAERLCDEYHARVKAERNARQGNAITSDSESPDTRANGQVAVVDTVEKKQEEVISDDNAFPLEGFLESEIECLTCHFKPKPNKTSFVNLTLNVPQRSSTTLDACIDGLFKSEQISDFKCDRCRLQHALEYKRKQRERLNSREADGLDIEIEKIERALHEDPEKVPDGANLPDAKLAPERNINKSVRWAVFPKILAIHLSRSIFDPGSASVKNSAKVSFPEILSIGSLLDRRKYKLLGVVAHQGSHSSGHYETFRRQVVYPAFSTPHNMNGKAALSPADEKPSMSPLPSPDSSSSPQSSPTESENTRPSTASKIAARASTEKSGRNGPSLSAESLGRFRRKETKTSNRWWRISDEKVRESKTSDVLSMQKEVYLLFYEMIDDAT